MQEHPVVKAARMSGVVGQGGAGFPAHVKLAAAVDTVIANGCECEPLLATDQHIMLERTSLLIEGLLTAISATGASRGIIAVKRKHTGLIAHLCAAIRGTELELFLVDDFYPAGDEQVLVYEVLGRTVPPLSLPKDVGCLVSNVGTLSSLAEAVHDIPVTERTVTVTGAITKPSVITVPVGTPVQDCIDHCGGGIIADWVAVLGGPVMGRVLDCASDIAGATVSKTTGGIILLPQGHYLHRNALDDLAQMRSRAATACIQCQFCSDLCPRQLIGHDFKTHQIMRAFAAGAEMENPAALQALLCCGCGVCEHVACPMGMSPCSINTGIKKIFSASGGTRLPGKGVNPEQAQWRDFRKTPQKRLAARIGISAYLDITPQPAPAFTPEYVDISLRQHIGKAAVPVCQPGARVKKGDLLGEIPAGALGARVHASISGTVEHVGESIRIRRNP